jgi:hypothetical protein
VAAWAPCLVYKVFRGRLHLIYISELKRYQRLGVLNKFWTTLKWTRNDMVTLVTLKEGFDSTRCGAKQEVGRAVRNSYHYGPEIRNFRCY